MGLVSCQSVVTHDRNGAAPIGFVGRNELEAEIHFFQRVFCGLEQIPGESFVQELSEAHPKGRS